MSRRRNKAGRPGHNPGRDFLAEDLLERAAAARRAGHPAYLPGAATEAEYRRGVQKGSPEGGGVTKGECRRGTPRFTNDR
jgi:hypothetical protein